MGSVNEAIRIIREWIIRTICQGAGESRGRVQITATAMPGDPIGPPLRCAYELEQVDQLGQQVEMMLAQLQTAVEALKACEDTTLVQSPQTALSNSEIMDTIGYMRSSIKRIQEFTKQRTNCRP